MAQDLRNLPTPSAKDIMFHLIPHILSAVIAISFEVFHLQTDSPLAFVLLIGLSISSLVCAIGVLAPMYKKYDYDGYYSEGYYESTIDSRGTITTQKVDGMYVSGGTKSNAFWLFIAGIFFSQWSIFHLIHILSKPRKLKRKFSDIAVEAYISARKTCSRRTHIESDKKANDSRRKMNRQMLDKVTNRYRVLGDEELNRRLAEVQTLPLLAHVDRKPVFLAHSSDRYHNFDFVLCPSEEYGVEGKILYGDHFIYMDDIERKNWRSIWAANGVDAHAAEEEFQEKGKYIF